MIIDRINYENSTPINPVCLDFIRKCLVMNEDERMGWSELYKHPLITHSIPDILSMKGMASFNHQ